VLEALAERALADGTPVTTIVLFPADTRFRPTSVIQAWVADLRSQLRPRDLAGILQEGEIGLLLHDTNAEKAAAVLARIWDHLGKRNAGQSFAFTIGLASRGPHSGETGSLLEAARADAMARSSAPSGDFDEQ
jgi:GGDEF domain-containing protein